MPVNFGRFKNFYEFLEYYRLNGKTTFEELREEVVHQKTETLSYRKYETGKLRPDGMPGFNTPTGRVELYSTMFRQFGVDPLPFYEEPQFSPVSTPEKMEEYPFVLTTGARTYCYFHSEGKQIPYLREMNPDPLIEINPEDALKLGIADGQWVRVSNPFGSCVLKAKVTQIVKPGRRAWRSTASGSRRRMARSPSLRGVAFQHQCAHPALYGWEAGIRCAVQVPDLQREAGVGELRHRHAGYLESL